MYIHYIDIYTFLCIYTCVYIYIYIHIIYIYIYTHIHTHTHTYINTYTYGSANLGLEILTEIGRDINMMHGYDILTAQN